MSASTPKITVSSVVLALVGGVLVAALLAEAVQTARRSALLKDGTPAPDFSAAAVGGGALSLSELRGQVVLLDFWATWCPPCREELPHLVKLAEEQRSKGVSLVAASCDDPHAAKVQINLFAERHLPALKAHRLVLASAEMTAQYRADTLPTLYIIDREGRIADAVRGAISERELRSRLDKVLSQTGASP